jgi:GNAT superfamily N-acetyltransferase
MENIITSDELRMNPGRITTAVMFSDGTTVTLRSLIAGDVRILGDYFLGLSAETRRRYGPHPFDRATAERLCASIDPAQTLRLIGTVPWDGAERIIGYFILILGIREDDAARYAKLGIVLNADTDCTLAPSVADDYQSQGLGSLMMRHLLDVARLLGRKRMVLWGGTQATNFRAIHFYHKYGFRTVGEFEEPPGFNNYDMILDL